MVAIYVCAKVITILNIVLNDFFECLRFSCVYNKGSEIISVVVHILKIYIYFVVSDAICRLSTFILDSRFFYSRLSTFLLSTLDFLLRLPVGRGGVLNSPRFCFFCQCRKLGYRSWVIPLSSIAITI